MSTNTNTNANRANIATRAAQLADIGHRKPTKSAAQDMLRNLFDRPAGYLIDADRDTLAELYRWFMPARPAKAISLFDWVAKACAGDKEARDYLRYVHVTTDHIEASDGHRLHRVERLKDKPDGDGLAPGYYFPNGDRVGDPDMYRWPNTDAVIPDDRRAVEILEGADMLGNGWEVLDTGAKPGGMVYARSMPDGKRYGVNKRYLEQALARPEAKGGETDVTPTMRVPDVTRTNGALKIRMGRALATIMPVKL